MDHNVLQYQSRAEPHEPSLFVPQNLGWLLQSPPPVLPEPEPVPHTQSVGVLDQSLFPQDLSWTTQDPDPIFLPDSAIPTQSVGPVSPGVFPQNLDWLVQHPEPPLPLPEITRHTQSEGVPEPSLFVPQNLAWIVVHPVPPPPVEAPVDEGGLTYASFEEITITPVPEIPLMQSPGPVFTPDAAIPFDWSGVLEPTLFVPQNLGWIVVHPPPPNAVERPVDEGGLTYASYEEITVVPVPDIPLMQSPGPVFLPDSAIPVDWSGVLEPSLFVPQNLSWIVQHPTPVIFPDPVEPGAFVFSFEIPVVVVPDFAWFVQASEPVLEIPSVVESEFWAGVLLPPDWFFYGTQLQIPNAIWFEGRHVTLLAEGHERMVPPGFDARYAYVDTAVSGYQVRHGEFVVVDSDGGVTTIIMPPISAANKGEEIIIVRDGINTIRIEGHGSDTVEGGTVNIISAETWGVFVSDGVSNWQQSFGT